MVATTGPVDSVTSVVMMTVLTFMISSSSSFASCRFTCAKTQWRRHLLFLPPSLIQYFLNTDKHQTKRQNRHDCYPRAVKAKNKLDHKHVSHNFYDSKPISLICLLTSILGWLVACSTRVSDTVLAMMFLQIRSTYGSGLSSWRILMMITLLNFLPSTGICFMMSSLLKIGSR